MVIHGPLYPGTFFLCVSMRESCEGADARPPTITVFHRSRPLFCLILLYYISLYTRLCTVIADCSGSLNASRLLLLLLGTSPVRPEVPLPRASTDVTFLFDTSSTSPCPGRSFISAWHKRLTVPICGLYKVTCNEGGAEASTIIG